MRGAAVIGWIVAAMLLVFMSIGRASDQDEIAVTVRVSSAEHESQEGYFALGKEATIMVRPGSELHRFLVRENGQRVRLNLTAVGGVELSRLRR